MHNYTIDINVDVGEGVNNESQLMPYISSCNIACGGHAGDVKTMRTVVKLAKQHQVKIGAHPSFPDKENFGRIPVEMPSVDLFKSIKTQIEALLTILKEAHLRLCHVKPHGALYNMAVKDERIATIIVEVIKSIALPLKLYAPYNSVISKIAIENNIPVIYEAFADRNYNNDLTLVSRQEKRALIEDKNEMFKHVYRMISDRKVKTIQGAEIDIIAYAFCIHGDNSKAVFLVKNLKEKLELHGVQIR